MDCDEFLRGYSEFRDRRCPFPVRSQFEEHLESCDSCRRYDRVLRRGVHVLRRLPTPCPSSDFLPRLKHRIYHLEDGIGPVDGSPAGTVALTAMAAVGLLALAWLPFALQAPVAEVQLAPVAVERPEGAPTMAASVFGQGPFITPLLRESGRQHAGEYRLDWPRAGTPSSATSLEVSMEDDVSLLPAVLQLR